jgi:tRNA nucleotidyltransferase (CCA-adding enzyme)
MVSGGEVDYLVPERVWAELLKALKEPNPSAFFYALKDCGALVKIFPEIDALFGVPQPAQHHPEIDTGVHCLMVLEQAALLSTNPEVRFAALVHDLGKALSPKDTLPHHYGHELGGLPVLEKLCNRLRVPNSYKNLAAQVMEYHTYCHKVMDLRAGTLTDVLTTLGVHKPQHKLAEFLLACEADARGRTGFEHRLYPQADRFRAAANAIASVDISPVLNGELQGALIGEAIRQLRIKAVAEVINAD